MANYNSPFTGAQVDSVIKFVLDNMTSISALLTASGGSSGSSSGSNWTKPIGNILAQMQDIDVDTIDDTLDNFIAFNNTDPTQIGKYKCSQNAYMIGSVYVPANTSVYINVGENNSKVYFPSSSGLDSPYVATIMLPLKGDGVMHEIHMDTGCIFNASLYSMA